MKIIKVSDKGQIAIPQSFREKLGITKGDDLVLFDIGGKLLIEKQQKVEKKLIEDFNDILKFSEKSLKEIWDNKEDNVWGEYLK
ncbi:AbrB/MazE/SpoVT family DNA-binding domain-containing protein [Candidatus Pacearchaeota archaeon]|nr:AbrB/MazE/SpoVT family DNA-binding domain-containing protein [Candidatus Pacearchaeota archaeon]